MTLFRDARRQQQYDAIRALLAPGESIMYSGLLYRMKAAGCNTGGLGVTVNDIAYRGSTQLWRRSEIVSYREPYFDHENEGNWTDGMLWITRAESAES